MAENKMTAECEVAPIWLKFFQMKPQCKKNIAPIKLSYKRHATFQSSMKLTVLIGQVYGLNPVLGITENDVSKLKFTYFSGRCLYSMISIVVQCLMACLSVSNIFSNPSLTAAVSLLIYDWNCIKTILYFKIAMKWPRLCSQIAKLEAVKPVMDDSLVWRCNVTCTVIVLLAAVTCGFLELSERSLAKACLPEIDSFDGNCLHNFAWVWSVIPYNKLFGLLAKFCQLQCVFSWEYSDAFIVCLSLYLIARLQEINNRLYATRGQSVPSSFWRTIRKDYTLTANLVKQVDDVVNGVIFVNFASNLFAICLFLLQILDGGLKPAPTCDVQPSERVLNGYEHLSFFAYTLINNIMRSLVMSLVASKVNTTSAEPAFALYDVPPDSFCIEVKRFVDQVYGDSVGLSGLNFFNVKRSMVLTIAATIVTYELVLIQFVGVGQTPKD